MNNKFKKWQKWVDIIYGEVRRLVEYKSMFWDVQEIIRRNKKLHKSNHFKSFLANSYAASALMGVRRQIKKGGSQVSLANLLIDMIEHPEAITEEHMEKIYMKHKKVNTKAFVWDLDRLEKDTRKCEKFADKVIAHRDKQGPDVVATFDDLDECIDLLEVLTLKYDVLLTGKHSDTLNGQFQYDWKEIFSIPWIDSK